MAHTDIDNVCFLTMKILCIKWCSFFLSTNTEKKETEEMKKKKLIVKPPEPDPKCCKICLVQAACSIEYYDECPEASSELKKDGLGFYWPIECEGTTTKEGLLEEGYSEDDIDFISQVAKCLRDIRAHKLTIRPATRRDRNVVKFVVTEYRGY